MSWCFDTPCQKYLKSHYQVAINYTYAKVVIFVNIKLLYEHRAKQMLLLYSYGIEDMTCGLLRSVVFWFRWIRPTSFSVIWRALDLSCDYIMKNLTRIDSHCQPQTVVRPSEIYNWVSYTNKMCIMNVGLATYLWIDYTHTLRTKI